MTKEKKKPDETSVEGVEYGLPPVLTVAEAASFLGVNAKTLYAAIAAGEAPGRRIGRRVVILRDVLLEWLRSSGRVLSSRTRRK